MGMHEHEGISPEACLKVIITPCVSYKGYRLDILILKAYADWTVRCIMLVLGDKSHKTRKPQIESWRSLPHALGTGS